MKYLSTEDIVQNGLSIADEVGQVFYYKNRVFRGIYGNRVQDIEEMFKSGLVDVLVEKKLIPKTIKSEYIMDAFPLILEHDKISMVSYVDEWTFDMIKDAGKLIFALVNVLGKYGYCLKDCHPYNILFHNNRPIYVDFGSIVKCEKKISCGKEFYQNYIMPLEALHFNAEMGRLVIRSKNDVGFDTMLCFSNGYGGWRLWKQIKYYLYKIHFKLNMLSMLYRKMSFLYYKQKMNRLTTPARGAWSNYQEFDFIHMNDLNLLPDDFKRYKDILKILGELPGKSILEFGGNSGGFSILATKKLMIDQYICTDYDESSINRLYKNIKKYSREYEFLNKIYPLAIDFCEVHKLYQLPNFEMRMRSDIVVAMALTHHLLLIQGMNIDSMFERLAMCTNKYLLIEFMPLGMWDGTGEGDFPEWYSLEWFIYHMKKRFLIQSVNNLEENRICIVGELIK